MILTAPPQPGHTIAQAPGPTVDAMTLTEPNSRPSTVRGPVLPAGDIPVLDVVVPVHNEERDLDGCVRRLHEASAGYVPPPDAVWRRGLVTLDPPIEDPEPELVSHNDVTPQNVVVRAGRAVGLIDFDLAGPTTRLIDAYNTAMPWVPLRPAADVWPTWRGVARFTRLRRFADAYGLTADERAALPDLGITRADATWHRMKASAEQLGGGWARMWAEGVGDAIRRRQRWLADEKADLLAALLS